MNRLDWQVLSAVHLAYLRERPSTVSSAMEFELSDTAIWQAGRDRFGQEWGGKLEESRGSYKYAPVISLSLGRLKKAGLVSRIDPGEGETYGFWRLTEEGLKLAEGMFGE